MEEGDKLPGGVTEAQIKQWKARWGEVNQITVKLEDRGVTGYFKKPGLDTIAVAGAFVGSDPVKTGNILFENCWLGGDEEMKTNDEVKFSAIIQVNKLFRIFEAEVKKL